MEYNQEKVDRIRELMGMSMRRKVFENINKDLEESEHIPYSTVCDVLQTYRTGGRKYYRNRRLKVYHEAVRLLAEKGVIIE